MRYFDLHCDTIFKLFDEDTDFCDSSLSVNRGYLNCFDLYYQSFAVWTPDNICDKSNYLNNCIDRYKKYILPYKSDTFKPMLSIEGSDFISEDLSILYGLKNENIISLSLTWNGENSLAGGSNSDASLKPLGKKVINFLNESGIYCDLSHLNRNSFYDVIEQADFVVATHNYIDEINPHKRNLTLEQMKLIKEKNGLVGLCYFPEFLGVDDVFEGIYKAIYFCLQNDLKDIIAFGSDFDGASIPITLNNIPDLYYYLSNKGIDNETLDLLFFLNAYNHFKSFDK